MASSKQGDWNLCQSPCFILVDMGNDLSIMSRKQITKYTDGEPIVAFSEIFALKVESYIHQAYQHRHLNQWPNDSGKGLP